MFVSVVLIQLALFSHNNILGQEHSQRRQIMRIKLESGRYWDSGIDPYSYQDAADNNREQILKSESCGCIGCGEIYPPFEITKWWDNGRTACCPKCGMTSVVVGSASGLEIDIEMLEMAGAHVVR
ncbi:hypothetical protein ACJJI4_12925 [Microbulbifer sp. TRSA002]|uniref:hypothetical protein n=1 Tax=Microbulbifer sp. TRSA002 TaxID=3243382 RepID=UPI00403A5A52